MVARYAFSKWFAKGHIFVAQPHGSKGLFFQCDGRKVVEPAYVTDQGFTWDGQSFTSRAALLRAVEAEYARIREAA